MEVVRLLLRFPSRIVSSPSSHPYRIVVFDWDGTSARRSDDAGRVRACVERLLRTGGLIVAVTGADFSAFDAELSARIRGPHKRRLFAATSGGSDIYGFDERTRPVLLETAAGPAGASDPVRWVLGTLAPKAGVPASEILVAEGPCRASAGTPADGASVQVVRDAADLVALLGTQAALRGVELPAAPTEDPTFRLVEEGFSLVREHELESIFAIGNGYLGSRGSLAEGSSLSFPATFVAGVFNRKRATPELAPMPDWMHVAARTNDQLLLAETGENLEHLRILDLENGILFRAEWRHRDSTGRITRIRGLRLASMADRHLLLQSIVLTPENYGGRVTVETPIPQPIFGRTTSGVVTVFVEATILEQPGSLRIIDGGGGQEQASFDVDVELGKTYRLDRIVAVHTSREGKDPLAIARRHLDDVLATEWTEGVVEAHRSAWKRLWDIADFRIGGDAPSQRAIRFAIYHLLSAANPEDDHVSIGARALTGGAYQGHVFWDTEIFMLPFFTLTLPAAARALLSYRFHTLPAARAKAKRLGFRGALYAWESADTGEEVTPPHALAPDGEIVEIRNGAEEHHVSADVAYAVFQYYSWTGDDRFLREFGAEIVLDTARFWASRVELGTDGRYHVRHVIGPDEYHESVDDDAYTNGMAQWNLETGAKIAALVEQRWPDTWRELCRRTGLAGEEPREWIRIAASMYTGFDPDTGLFEQFRGYRDLEFIDLTRFQERRLNMDIVLGQDRIQRSQVIKQADVLMLVHLLWDRFSPEVREANFRFYLPRTDHGSSLSPPVHALLAARLGDLPLAERYFRRTADIDLADNMGNAAGGIHAAALGGLWQAAVFGFAGLEIAPSGPLLDPRLPRAWERVEFGIEWRGRRYPMHAETPREAESAPPLEALP